MALPSMTKHAYDRLKERFGTYYLPDIFTSNDLVKVIFSMGDGEFRTYNAKIVIRDKKVITVIKKRRIFDLKDLVIKLK